MKKIMVVMAIVASATALAASSASASPDAGHHPRFAVGFKASYLAGFPHGQTVHHVGGGAFFEWVALPGWLELELGFRVLGGEHGTALPVELLAKYPIHLTDTVHLFVGAGPVVVGAFSDGDSSVYAGVAAVAGTYLCLWPHWAIVLEAAYELLREHGVTVHEIGANAGLAWRF